MNATYSEVIMLAAKLKAKRVLHGNKYNRIVSIARNSADYSEAMVEIFEELFELDHYYDLIRRRSK